MTNVETWQLTSDSPPCQPLQQVSCVMGNLKTPFTLTLKKNMIYDYSGQMNTVQINRALKQVSSYNEENTNTDPSHKPGMRWVAFYLVSKGEFFDSYEYPPDHYQSSFKNFLDILTIGILTVVSYKVHGLTFAVNIVYFT